MGLVIFGMGLLYLLVSTGIVMWVVRYARKNDKNTKRWGIGTALVMYLLVFWDYLPTVITHKYYCETRADFTIFKTLNEWKVENPEVFESFITNKKWPEQYIVENDGHKKIRKKTLNKRFNIIVSQQDVNVVLPIIRRKEILKDMKTSEVIAEYIGFATGNSVKNTIGPPGPMKFWLRSPYCDGGRDLAISSRLWMNKFRGIDR